MNAVTVRDGSRSAGGGCADPHCTWGLARVACLGRGLRVRICALDLLGAKALLLPVLVPATSPRRVA